MKRTLALLLILTFAMPAIAQDAKKDKKSSKPQVGKSIQGAIGASGVTLTTEQKAKLAAIFKSNAEAQENWKKENAEAVKAIKAEMKTARENQDRDAMKAASKKYKILSKSKKTLTDNLYSQVRTVLGEDANKVFEAYRKGLGSGGGDQDRNARRGSSRRGNDPVAQLMRLKLSDDQKTKVKIILDEAKLQGQKTESAEVRAKLMKDAVDKIKGSVLTPDQIDQIKKAEAARSQRGGNFGRVELSEKQRAQRSKIREKARTKMKNAETSEEKRKIYREAADKMKGIYTDDQKKQMEKGRERMKKMMTDRFKQSPLGKALNEEQTKQFFETMKDARKAASEAESRDDRRKAFTGAIDKFAETLPDDQREKFNAARKEMRKHMSERGRGGRGGNRGSRNGGGRSSNTPDGF
jgi:hypothetical protein